MPTEIDKDLFDDVVRDFEHVNNTELQQLIFNRDAVRVSEMLSRRRLLEILIAGAECMTRHDHSPLGIWQRHILDYVSQRRFSGQKLCDCEGTLCPTVCVAHDCRTNLQLIGYPKELVEHE